MHTDTIWLLSAEIVLLVAAVSIYLAGTVFPAPKLWVRWRAAAFSLAAVALWRLGYGPSGPMTLDPLACGWLALALGAILVLLNSRPLPTGGTAEYLGTLLLLIAGLMLVAGAGDLVLLFVSLELISIPTYILLYMGRRDAACQESAAKYFFLSILASRRSCMDSVFSTGDRLHAVDDHSPRAGRSTGRAGSVRAVCQAGDGADYRRAELPRHRSAVPFLCPRRLSGHDPSQRRAAVGRAEGGRACRFSCDWC